MLLARRERESFFQGSSFASKSGRLRCVQQLQYFSVKPFWDQELEFLPERDSGTLNSERIQDGHSFAFEQLMLVLRMSQRNSKCC